MEDNDKDNGEHAIQLKMLLSPIFLEPNYAPHSARQEKALTRLFQKYSHGQSGLIDCNRVVGMLSEKGIIRDKCGMSFYSTAVKSNQINPTCLKNEEKHNLTVRQREVEVAYNSVRMRQERKISFDAFKKMLLILGTKMYPQFGELQAFDLIKQQIV